MTDHPFLSYGRQWIDAEDEAAVLAALRSPFLAHGPRVGAFETAFAKAVGAQDAVACSSGTAALHLLYCSLDLPVGSRVLVPAITFLATATAAILAGLEPVLSDVDPRSGLMTPAIAEAALAVAERNGKPISLLAPVHLGGAICDLVALQDLASRHGAHLVEDACHALGGRDAEGVAVGAARHSQGATFSFHPVKTLAAGEGGMITLNGQDRAERLRRLRNHAVTRVASDLSAPHSFDAQGEVTPWTYEQTELGFNYRMCEMEAALGLSQLGKLEMFAARRRHLVGLYAEALQPLAPLVALSATPPGQDPCRHLLTVFIDFVAADISRAQVMKRLAATGIGSQVHYIPLYRQPYFHHRLGEMRLQGAEAWYAQTLSLPLFPAMDDDDVARVVAALAQVLGRPS